MVDFISAKRIIQAFLDLLYVKLEVYFQDIISGFFEWFQQIHFLPLLKRHYCSFQCIAHDNYQNSKKPIYRLYCTLDYLVVIEALISISKEIVLICLWIVHFYSCIYCWEDRVWILIWFPILLWIHMRGLLTH